MENEPPDTSADQRYDKATWMKKRVECIQAAYLVCSLQKREGSVEAQGRVRRYRHATLVMVRIEFLSANLADKNSWRETSGLNRPRTATCGWRAPPSHGGASLSLRRN